MLCVRTVKSVSTCFLLPFTACVFLSNLNMLFLTFFTCSSIFPSLLIFTDLNVSISFLPVPQFPLPTSPKKNEHMVKYCFSHCFSFPSLPDLSLILSHLPLTFLMRPEDVFPQLFMDLFTYIFIAFGYCPYRSPHIFHISHQLPVLT